MSRLNQFINQKQTQNLMLKPKMLQSLEMLTMPLLELELYLKHELETNPMMEMQDINDEDDDETVNDNVEETDTLEIDKDEDPELVRTIEESQELSEILDSWNEQFEDYSYNASTSEKTNFELFIKQYENRNQYFFNQLDELNLKENEYDFAFDLIDSTNEHGFLPKNFDLYNFSDDYKISKKRADQIHELILHFEPVGITARNIEECLIAQIDTSDEQNEILSKLILNDFDDLIHKRYKKIALKYNVDIDTVIICKEQIAHLDPKPGLRLQNNQTDYIMPDVIIKKIGDDFEVIVNDYNFPKIRMSRHYKSLLNDVKADKKSVEYVRDKINSAKFLIKSIYLRNKTLKLVAKAIIKYQHDYFYENSRNLRPMVYSVIANDLQVCESTISRVVKTKYADTPFGIMCLKDFFTSKAGKDLNYNAVSRQSIEIKMKKYIEYEDNNNPLSDQDISDKLQQEGFRVSRRLISKYRKALRILNSHLRRNE